MNWLSPNAKVKRLWIFCDGGAGGSLQLPPGQVAAGSPPLALQAGCGAAARNDDGAIVEWAWRPLPTMTNNEAEYAGLLLGLELALRLRPALALCVLDSATVVGQMRGECATHSSALRPWQRQAQTLARRLPAVHYLLVPREFNCLADALARQARLPWPALHAALIAQSSS